MSFVLMWEVKEWLDAPKYYFFYVFTGESFQQHNMLPKYKQGLDFNHVSFH